MRRIHLFEIEDQSWCPHSIRDAITDCLQFGMYFLDYYRPIIPRLKEAIQNSGADGVLDLCSGGGGPWPLIWSEFDESAIAINLSDKYPNFKALNRMKALSDGKINFYIEPVDAARVGLTKKGFRTLFNSFHHFRPDDARAIIQNAVECGEGVGIFESTGRNLMSFLLVAGMPIFMFLCAPFMRPFRLSRLFWTYIIPAAPIIGFLDGIVSCWRTYSRQEMAELVKGLSTSNFNWEIGEKRGPILGAPILYLIGIPKK